MFNFNFYLLMYFLKHQKFTFSLFSEDKRDMLNNLTQQQDIRFIFKKTLKLIPVSYFIQQSLLFLSFIMLGFFIFSSFMNIFHFDNVSLGLQKTWEDFSSLHYITFFIIFLSLFGLFSLFNIFIQIKTNNMIEHLKNNPFPVSYYVPYFQQDIQRVSATPLYNVIISNNNLYGLLVLLVFEKHVEKEEIKFIPDYFFKHW